MQATYIFMVHPVIQCDPTSFTHIVTAKHTTRRLWMAITPVGAGANGFCTRQVQARVVFCTYGPNPHPTCSRLGSGLGVDLDTRVAVGRPNIYS
jgi:hypothetical protein